MELVKHLHHVLLFSLNNNEMRVTLDSLGIISDSLIAFKSELTEHLGWRNQGEFIFSNK